LEYITGMTIDPVEIEGTPERAADRGLPDGFGFFASDIGDKNYLGSPEVVGDIVRTYCQDALALRVKAGRGEMLPNDALEGLHALAERTAAIFTNPGDAYRSMLFNSVDGVGEFVKAALQLDASAEDAVKTLFLNTSNQIFETHAQYLAGTVGDDDVRFQLDAAVEDATRMLLGLPEPRDQE
jgi:hypothetical protein